MIHTIIPSLNRACQLHALLESWQRFVWGDVPHILYCYTTDDFRRGYHKLRDRWSDIFRWHPQVHFRVDTLALLDSGEQYTMFLVDDMLVRRPIVVNDDLVSPLHDPDVLCHSLRLSPNIKRSFNANCDCPPPPLEMTPYGHRWRWRNQRAEWGYPMSLDAHIFRTCELLSLAKRLDWNNPNQLENAICQHPFAEPLMACRDEHAVTNVPGNLVQTTFRNRTCLGPTAESLNQAWLAGRKIDIDPIIALDTTSTHVDQQYKLVHSD